MTEHFEREVAVFNEARLLPAAQLAAYLQKTCAGDTALRQRVEELLQFEQESGAFLQDPAPGAQRGSDGLFFLSSPQMAEPPGEKAGDRIGRYKLLQQIGEGGCGVVYMAEQEEPVRRRVALKVIKLGMDTKHVIARFEAERQALALMDHASIAKVLDAGATTTGRPYFVMELVRGIKLTDYCDEHGLPTRERLKLFFQVCQAIQHAHQKGIIHRDIKPSNILVTLNNGEPLPKVIDFGIAKATQGRLTDKTLFTAFEQFVGTPAYMSPEQAVMANTDVDTRSDIYSLGVLLYELLTGRTPFDGKELLSLGLDEMRRTIREKQPIRPSTRLSTMVGVDLNTVAKHRQAEPMKLARLIRGDLDWIVMKSLEKDPTRRYETAESLAIDIKRYLNQEPVLARPQSLAYRLEKLVHRNKAAFTTAVIVLSAFLLAGVFAFQAYHARHQEQAERQQGAIDKTLLAAWSGDFTSAEEFLREAELAGAGVPDVRMLRGLIAFQGGEYSEAVRHLQQAVRLNPSSVAAQSMLLKAYIMVGRWPDAEPIFTTLARLSPHTQEDYLFLGSAQGLLDPSKGLETLDKAVLRRPSGTARLFRGQVRYYRAQESGDLADLEAAQADAAAANVLLPGSPVAVALSLNVQLAAAGLYDEHQDFEKREQAQRDAANAASILANYPKCAEAFLARVCYLKQFTNDLNLVAELQRANVVAENNYGPYNLALSLYRLGRIEEASVALSQQTVTEGPWQNFLRCFILADLPDGPTRASEEFFKAWEHKASLFDALEFQNALRFLGRRSEAVALSRELQLQASSLLPVRNNWYRHLLDYDSDRLSEDALLELASASRWNQLEAHFHIGLSRLADGDRTGAGDHFRAAVATKVFQYYPYDWSRAFLSRMEQDPKWPPWIPPVPR
jgi:serine/threonine protein kinase